MADALVKIGFIGLGSLGAPIARRLARRGFEVIGCDVAPQMLQAFDEPGTTRNADPIETARLAEWVGICVRTDEQLKKVVDGGKLFDALGKGGLVILQSTVSPALARELAVLAKTYGVGFVDAGSSGGAPAAIEGQLTLFIGGEEADVEQARPWLEAIGKTVVHLGPVGRGQEGKLLNNLISIANYGMSAAIVDVAVALGFERDKFIDVLMSGSAQSFALKVAPGMVRKRTGLGATGSLMGLHDLLKKDVDLCRELPASDPVSMQALLTSCEAMLARIKRAAADAGQGDQPT
jgi:3-hydroxyisobutyrate dehydrogenase